MADAGDPLQRAYRVRILIFLACVVIIVAALFVIWQGVGTLNRLDVVESERDQWQRPEDVIRALGVHPGSAVADLGCGSGYFTLRLSPVVGARGLVLAEDIRRLPLVFLRARALLGGRHNIRIIHGTVDDPSLGDATANAVLIANTYHELDHPRTILAAVRRALRPRGRLVILDRGPRAGSSEPHAIARMCVERDLMENGFQVAETADPFIDRPGDDPWWMIAADAR